MPRLLQQSSFLDEDHVTFPNARQFFPGARKPSLNSMHRWATRGTGGVVLESLRVGHYRYTSKEAVMRYLSAINEQSNAPEFV